MNLVKILNHLYEILQVSRLQVTVIKRIKSRKTSVIYLFSNVSFVIVFLIFILVSTVGLVQSSLRHKSMHMRDHICIQNVTSV